MDRRKIDLDQRNWKLYFRVLAVLDYFLQDVVKYSQKDEDRKKDVDRQDVDTVMVKEYFCVREVVLGRFPLPQRLTPMRSDRNSHLYGCDSRAYGK